MEYSARRIRSWLEGRYQVDTGSATDQVVVARAARLLGVPVTGAAGDVVAVCHRLDADREYERDSDGRFATTGGGSSSDGGERRPADSGIGAARNHHEIARGHADRARSAAKGTSSAARASARKAEEHAELARVAAEFDDHDKAAHHSREAERHSLAAQMKATVHAGGRRRSEPGDRATVPVKNKPMVEIMAEGRRPPPTPLSDAERQRTAKVHAAMAEATAEAARREMPVDIAPTVSHQTQQLPTTRGSAVELSSVRDRPGGGAFTAKLTSGGREIGEVRTLRHGAELKVNEIEISPEFRGQGHGRAAYEQLAREADRRGATLVSDRGTTGGGSRLSPDAERVWQGFVRRGEAVRENLSEEGLSWRYRMLKR